jgi:4-hydroxythreonine-4-phosphate dehydrogenase
MRTPGDPLRADALVTAPISKEAWALAGHGEFPGHTEFLAARCGTKRVRMMFVTPSLNVMLVTSHVPLARVPALLTIERVLDTIELGHEACRTLGPANPRIAVCGVNPHAGESGLLGDEEARSIAPAIRAARERGIDATGPFPGDTLFRAALQGRYDLVVAMYHDQGIIPVKLLAFDRAVNLTAGLPIVRTSPDHGTAYDIAGKNLANPGSMHAAIDLAVRLARSRF